MLQRSSIITSLFSVSLVLGMHNVDQIELPGLVFTPKFEEHLFKGQLVYKNYEHVQEAAPKSWRPTLNLFSTIYGFFTLSSAPAATKRGVLEGYHDWTQGEFDPAKELIDTTNQQDNGVFHITWGQTINGIRYVKKEGSTIFPLKWSRAQTAEESKQQIKDKIIESYKHPEKVTREGDRFVVIGPIVDENDSSLVVPIQTVVADNGDGITSYALLANEYTPKNNN